MAPCPPRYGPIRRASSARRPIFGVNRKEEKTLESNRRRVKKAAGDLQHRGPGRMRFIIAIEIAASRARLRYNPGQPTRAAPAALKLARLSSQPEQIFCAHPLRR